MNPQEQRVALADWAGWTEIDDRMPRGVPPGGHIDESSLLVPDYLSDLNAVHELEKRLKPVEAAFYIQELEAICSSDICFATASQRCRAMLRAIGLWKY